MINGHELADEKDLQALQDEINRVREVRDVYRSFASCLSHNTLLTRKAAGELDKRATQSLRRARLARERGESGPVRQALIDLRPYRMPKTSP